jgi:hypothetical protein
MLPVTLVIDEKSLAIARQQIRAMAAQAFREGFLDATSDQPTPDQNVERGDGHVGSG